MACHALFGITKIVGRSSWPQLQLQLATGLSPRGARRSLGPALALGTGATSRVAQIAKLTQLGQEQLLRSNVNYHDIMTN